MPKLDKIIAFQMRNGPTNSFVLCRLKSTVAPSTSRTVELQIVKYLQVNTQIQNRFVVNCMLIFIYINISVLRSGNPLLLSLQLNFKLYYYCLMVTDWVRERPLFFANINNSVLLMNVFIEHTIFVSCSCSCLR